MPDGLLAPVAALPAGGVRTGARAWFTPQEWLRLAGLYGFVAVLHVLGWGLFLHYSAGYPAMLGLGLVAYLFGLRHAFDADHIAAVDDTVRFMMQRGERPLGIGFFFSLGHSTIVFGLAVALILATATVTARLPALETYGAVIGASVSGIFLWVIGILNLLVLLDILKAWGQSRSGRHNHDHIEELLGKRGFINRLLGDRLQKTIRHSWQMYPVGLLFGLGFDTASEVGLLAMAATASASNLPVPAVLSLPILFAAGMTIMDTTDGVLMTQAYEWAFVNPVRKLFYNITITSLSVVVALLIGSVELLQVLVHALGLEGAFFDLVAGIEIGHLGYALVALLIGAWAVSFAVWRLGRFEARVSERPPAHAHPHVHDSGVAHSHRHFH